MIEVESITNQIINADCMDILKQLPDKCIDLVLTDPPYKQEYKTSYGTEKTITRQNYSKIGDYGSNSKLDFTEFFELLIPKLKKINIFIFCDKETKFDFMIMAKNKGFSFREIPFCKTSPTPFCNNQWLPDVEWGLHIYNELEVMGDYSTKKMKTKEDEMAYFRQKLRPYIMQAMQDIRQEEIEYEKTLARRKLYNAYINGKIPYRK